MIGYLIVNHFMDGASFTAVHDLFNQFFQNMRIFQTQCIGHIVGNLIWIGKHHQQFIVMLRPASLRHIILGIQQFPVVDHFIKNVGSHIHGHHGATRDLIEEGGRIRLQNTLIRICIIDARLNTGTVLLY